MRRIETVVESLLAVAGERDPRTRDQACHVAELAERMSQAVAGAPPAQFVHRCAMLALMPPEAIEQVPEVAACGAIVREFQTLSMSHPAERPSASTASLILAVADELDSLMFRADRTRRMSSDAALRFMQRHADDRTRPVVEAAIASLR